MIDILFFLVFSYYSVNILLSDETIRTVPITNKLYLGSEDFLNQMNTPATTSIYAIFNTLLVFYSSLKLMSLMKVITKLGELTNMLIRVFQDISVFTGFMLFWIITITALYIVMGASVGITDEDSYAYIDFITASFINSFMNAIGNISTPDYTFWKNMLDYDEEGSMIPVYSMIYLLWIVWTINNVIVFVILLNFFIAIIGGSY